MAAASGEPQGGGPGAGFWDRLFGRGTLMQPGAGPALPAGEGPLIWLRLDAGQPLPERGTLTPVLSGPAALLAAALRRGRPGLRFVVSHPEATGEGPGLLPDPGTDPLAARAMLAAASPAVLLLVGGGLPHALLDAAERQEVPVVWACGDLGAAPAPGFWHRGRLGSLSAVTRLFVIDAMSRAAALRHGFARLARRVSSRPAAVVRGGRSRGRGGCGPSRP